MALGHVKSAAGDYGNYPELREWLRRLPGGGARGQLRGVPSGGFVVSIAVYFPVQHGSALSEERSDAFLRVGG